jgi:hypothetical protein
MPTSTDVNLPKSYTAVFPDRCVKCGQDQPGDTYRATTRSVGWWTVTFWAGGEKFGADVPVCPGCKGDMTRQRWARNLVCWAFMLGGAGVALWLFKDFNRRLGRWLAGGIVFACLVPYLAWEIFFPRPFDLTAFAETVDYEFRDPAYAAEFARLNGVAPPAESDADRPP